MKLDLPDARYTVSKEGTGSLTHQQVARFCGCWIGCFETPELAAAACREAYDNRMRRHIQD